MADIFVSYASEDRDRIKPLIEALQAEGWSVWWDRDLVAGPSFDEKIEEALDAARCVVVAWSEHSVKSRWCRAEASEGLERQILVPMRLDDVRPPLAFRSSQTASLIGWPQNRGELDALQSGIRACLGSPSESLFVGRKAILDRWEAILEGVMHGRGRVVLLTGEPGIGKSRTAEELGRLARTRGISVYSGWCDESSVAPPYWPWIQIFRGLLDNPIETLQSDFGSAACILSTMVPEVREHLPDVPAPPGLGADEMRFRLSDAICSVLKRIASRGPVVLFLDDLHRADVATLAVLCFLARTIAREQIIVLGTYRDAEVDRSHPLGEALGELARCEAYERTVLTGLADGELEELASQMGGDAADRGVIDAISEKTDGNPLFAAELIRAFVEGARDERDSGAAFAVPSSLREIILGRLSDRSSTCRRALEIGSVLGRDLDLELVEAVGAMDADEVDTAIDEARKAGMVVDGSNGNPRFAHILIRDAVYEVVGRRRRVELHRSVAEAMVITQPVPTADESIEQASVIAHHWELAGEYLDAARWQRSAARWASRTAMDHAVEHWRRVHKFARSAPESDESRALVLTACKRILGNAHGSGYLEGEADSLFAEGMSLAKNDDLASRVQLTYSFGNSKLHAGQTVEAVSLLDDALRLAESSADQRLYFQTQGGAFFLTYGHRRFDEWLADIDRYIELTVEVGRRVSPDLLRVKVAALVMLGRLDEATAHIEAFTVDQGARKLACAELYYRLGEPERSLSAARELLLYAENVGSTNILTRGHLWIGAAHLLNEDWQPAIDEIETALDVSRRTRQTLNWEPLMIGLLAKACLGAGDVSHAHTLTAEAIDLSRRQGRDDFECEAQLVLAQTMLREQANPIEVIETTLERAAALAEGMRAMYFRPPIEELKEELGRLTKTPT